MVIGVLTDPYTALELWPYLFGTYDHTLNYFKGIFVGKGEMNNGSWAAKLLPHVSEGYSDFIALKLLFEDGRMQSFVIVDGKSLLFEKLTTPRDAKNDHSRVIPEQELQDLLESKDSDFWETTTSLNFYNGVSSSDKIIIKRLQIKYDRKGIGRDIAVITKLWAWGGERTWIHRRDGAFKHYIPGDIVVFSFPKILI